MPPSLVEVQGLSGRVDIKTKENTSRNDWRYVRPGEVKECQCGFAIVERVVEEREEEDKTEWFHIDLVQGRKDKCPQPEPKPVDEG